MQFHMVAPEKRTYYRAFKAVIAIDKGRRIITGMFTAVNSHFIAFTQFVCSGENIKEAHAAPMKTQLL